MHNSLSMEDVRMPVGCTHTDFSFIASHYDCYSGPQMPPATLFPPRLIEGRGNKKSAIALLGIAKRSIFVIMLSKQHMLLGWVKKFWKHSLRKSRLSIRIYPCKDLIICILTLNSKVFLSVFQLYIALFWLLKFCYFVQTALCRQNMNVENTLKARNNHLIRLFSV